jgi:hypothetical protein
MQLLKTAGRPKYGLSCASFSQRVQPPLSALVSLLGCTCHRTQAGSVGHGPVLKEDEITVLDGDNFAPVSPFAMDASDSELATFDLVVEICHGATGDQADALGFKPRLAKVEPTSRTGCRWFA